MERHAIAPRTDWQATVEAQGLIWHSDGDQPYWDESAYYSFTLAEIETIEAASETVYDLFLQAGDKIVGDAEMMELFGIPAFCHRAIRQAWKDEPPSLNYGRFDFGYDGEGEPKLFEFNCDTPTSMLEASVIQWEWKESLFPALDQFNSLHEKLVGRWAELRPRLFGQRVWFTHSADPAHEDTITTTYMRDLASQAGLDTHAVLIDDIGVDAGGRILDREDQVITSIFKLYPWEWIVAEPFGQDVVRNLPETAWIEPIWKMVWSNKAILQLLWTMFPNHPNLLAASVRQERIGGSYVAKPFLAREGANIEIVDRGETIARSQGEYREGLTLYQELYRLRDFGSGYPVLGAWIVDGEAAGLGIREDGLITGNRARFIPHVIRG
ncbi:glutathionylspermidine synthase family protein [Sphingomonas parva]|uniref:Glutathionylspermidine synthase family protein n=1 Tax=Sphingomonas parva TaxID=2555898 RepID=A0A4Y8ZNV1_9SPHN|nr:glutathionylspermidine synthase family protein [Sphingomonas parva]TFI56952.1 glutathionylspermidine synthase family protein [Sphingomonas parva]